MRLCPRNLIGRQTRYLRSGYREEARYQRQCRSPVDTAFRRRDHNALGFAYDEFAACLNGFAKGPAIFDMSENLSTYARTT